MKRLLIVCVLLFSIITLAQAQNAGHKKMASPEERAKMSAERLSKRLDLNKDQSARIEDIYLEESKAMGLAKTNSTGDKASKKAEMMKIHNESEAKLTAELTEPQKQKYEAWKMENKKQMKKGGGTKRKASPAPTM